MAKVKPLMRWNRLTICREFGIDSRTLGKRLIEAGIDQQQTFTTKELFSVMVGDLGAERIRLTREQADKAALENAVRRGELVEVSAAAAAISRAIGSIKSYILGLTHVPEEDRDEILVKCKALYDAAFNPADAHDGDVEPAAEADS